MPPSVSGWVAALLGFFVCALLGSIIALMFFISVGLAHYIVLFVTLYQRLPMSEKWEEQYYRLTAGQQPPASAWHWHPATSC